MTKQTFETGKTYIFRSLRNGTHFRGMVIKRTKKTITVKAAPEAMFSIWRVRSEEEAAAVKPTTFRLRDLACAPEDEIEYAVSHKVGRFAESYGVYSCDLARRQM